jgi:hypothetical protein
VDALAVFETKVLYDPEPTRYSILYPVIGYPPVFAGGDHERFTCVGDAGTALRPIGAPGFVPEDDDVGVADASDEDALVPTELIAYT